MTVTIEEIDQLRLEFDLACVQSAEAKERERIAKNRLERALVSFANEHPHPLQGKVVSRKVRHGFRRGQTRTLRGTVMAYDPELHRNLRELPYKREPGMLIVVTSSGQTGYGFSCEVWPELGETNWEESDA